MPVFVGTGIEQFADDAAAIVTSGGTTAPAAGTSESWTVTAATAFPVATAGEFFYIADTSPSAEHEKILVTSAPGGTGAGQSWTVTRGADGTTPVTHAAGFAVVQVITAASLQALAAGAGMLSQTAVKTANYTAATGQIVPVNTTSGNVTVTLPAAPAAGTLVAVKHVIQGGTNAVTVAAAGSDVFNKAGGATSGTLSLASQGMLLQYQSGIWMVLADDLPLTQLDLRYAAGPLPASGDTTGVADHTAIAAAVAAVPAAGGVVQLAAGTYYLHSGVTIPAGVIVAGQGQNFTTVNVVSGVTGVIPFLIQNVSNAGVRDLTLNCNKAGTTSGGNGIYVNASSVNMTGIDIRRVNVINGASSGVALVAFPLTVSIGFILEDVTASGCAGTAGVNVFGGSGGMIVRPNVTGCSQSGIYVQASTGIQVIDAVSNGNTSHGLTVNSASTDIKISGGHFNGSTAGYGIAVSIACVNFTITGPTCNGNQLGGISVDTANSAGLVTGTATSGSVTTLADTGKTWTTNQWAGYTVRLTGGTGSGESAVITSNTATTLTFPAVITAPDNTSAYSIDGNHIFYDVGATISGAICANNTLLGIWVDYCSNLTITGCEVHHNGSHGVDLTSQYCLVTGNDIHDNGGRGVLINQGSDPMGGHRVTGNTYRNNQAGVNVSQAGTSIPNIVDEYVQLGQTVTLVTATNSTWPIPSGANYLEITAVGGGGQGGGGGSATTTATVGGGGGGAAGQASTQVVAIGSNATLNVTIGAGGTGAGAGGVAGGGAGGLGVTGTATTVTGTGISVKGGGGAGGGGAAGLATITYGLCGIYGSSTQSSFVSAGNGGFNDSVGGAPSGGSAGGGGSGQAATATIGGAGGGGGTAIAGGAGGTGGNGVAAGGAGSAAAANTGGGGGGGGGGAAGTGAGGAGGAGGSGFVIVRVVG